MIRKLTRFVNETSGATAIEYALIAALIAMAVVPAMVLLGGNLKTSWGQVANGFK